MNGHGYKIRRGCLRDVESLRLLGIRIGHGALIKVSFSRGRRILILLRLQ